MSKSVNHFKGTISLIKVHINEFSCIERITQVFRSLITEVALPVNTMLGVTYQLFNLKCTYFSRLKVMTSGIIANQLSSEILFNSI